MTHPRSLTTLHDDPRARALRRAGWLLWGVTFTLLLALAATVPALYAPLLNLLGQEDAAPWLRDPVLAAVAVFGLVSVFVLYTITKQREIDAMRDALHREERERHDSATRLLELSELFQVSTTLQLQFRLDVMLEIIVRRVVSTHNAQQASIMIVDGETGELVTRASYGLEAEFSKGARRKPGEGIAGWVAQRRQAVMLGEKLEGGDFAAHYKSNRRITSSLSLPLSLGDRVVGVLNVNRINNPEPFSESHLEGLRMFGEHVAAVIDRAEMMERLDDRTRQLEADNEKLSDLNRIKDVFLSTASHELKTPLTSVIAYAEILDDHDSRLSREQARDFVGRLRTEAQRLMSLIEDILDLSRMESGKLALKLRATDLREVVSAAVETSRSLARKYGVELESAAGGELPALGLDEVKIRQVVVNLLVNAIKFSPRGGTVRVSARVDDRYVRLEVRDDGPGVAPEMATHIFELFGQAAAPEGEGRMGVGIGLHLVKRISELHGGHVGVDSRPGLGSTFWVRLPIPEAAESGAESRAAA